MRLLAASIVIGPLMLIGALPAAADQSSPSGTHIQLAAASNSAAERDTYTQRTRDDMRQWQQKLHDFGENAKATGQQAGNAAGNELNAAWTKTQAEAGKLQAASADGWESAKASPTRRRPASWRTPGRRFHAKSSGGILSLRKAQCYELPVSVHHPGRRDRGPRRDHGEREDPARI